MTASLDIDFKFNLLYQNLQERNITLVVRDEYASSSSATNKF